jgi:hypothetical protein
MPNFDAQAFVAIVGDWVPAQLVHIFDFRVVPFEATKTWVMPSDVTEANNVWYKVRVA